MAKAPLLGGLAARMALSAHGFGAVIAGILDIRTVTDSRRSAALNALYVVGINPIVECNDPDCECVERGLARLRPDIKIVPVVVEARDG